MTRKYLAFLILILSFLTSSSILITACTNSNPTGPLANYNPTPTPYSSTAYVSTLAGSAGVTGAINATGTAASFNLPTGVAVDSFGNIYVADQNNDLIRKITAGGVVTTLAGQAGVYVSTNATGTAASFNSPTGVAVDTAGNVYVADMANCLIRKITAGGIVSTLAGQPRVNGSTNATGTAASFYYPTGVAVDTAGNVYVADSGNNLIRKITSGGVVTTLAGSLSGGSTNGTGTAASFYNPTEVAVDSSGNVYVTDTYNYLIRKITPGGVVTTLAGGGSGVGTNGIGTAASFNQPFGVAVDTVGNIYVTDTLNNLIRKITSGGVVTTMAGEGSGFGVHGWPNPGSTNGMGPAASFNFPTGITVDSSGNVYIGDQNNNMIRKITP